MLSYRETVYRISDEVRCREVKGTKGRKCDSSVINLERTTDGLYCMQLLNIIFLNPLSLMTKP